MISEVGSMKIFELTSDKQNKSRILKLQYGKQGEMVTQNQFCFISQSKNKNKNNVRAYDPLRGCRPVYGSVTMIKY